MGSPQSQIKFTTSSLNPEGIWNLPHEYYKLSFEPLNFSVDLFAIDTNGSPTSPFPSLTSLVSGCQSHVVRSHSYTPDLLREEGIWLDQQLKESAATWKIAFGHHPMYTRGKGHRDPCVCLREESYQYMMYHRTRHEEVPVSANGFGFENIFANGGVDLYVSGHEHVFQHHSSRGILHVICGNSGADMRRGYGFYGGENKEQDIDWFDRSNSPGFVEFRLTEEMAIVNFINSDGTVFHTVTKSK